MRNLHLVCQRYDMFGIRNLGEMIAFFNGSLMGLGDDLWKDIPSEFQDWVTKRFNYPPNIGWIVVVERSLANETNPYLAFFALVQEFQERKSEK